MKTLITALAALTLLSTLSSSAFAAQWRPRLSCAGGSFVVDGLENEATGFTDHQVVLRDARITKYFQGLVGQTIPTNEKGEFIKQGLGSSFTGNFNLRLAEEKLEGDGESIVYALSGHWQNRSYVIEVTRSYCGPGSCDSQGAYLGNWTFSDCQGL